MPDEVKPDQKQTPTHDAQLAADNMNTGKEKTPKVDLDKDYETSKQYSVSDIDRTSAGAQAAESATQSGFEFKPSETTNTTGATTGNPNDYLDMAKDVKPENEAATNVDDDLIKKALDKGKPGQ